MKYSLSRQFLTSITGTVVVLFALSLQALAQTTPKGLPSPVVPNGFGVNIHFTSPQPNEMEKLSAVGFGVVRMDVYWQNVEKTKGVYDFSAYDQLTDLLTKNNIRPLYILCYGNPLYDGGRPPETDAARAAYAAFAGATAARYEGRNILWEIWNEPNSNTFWKTGANPEKYAALAIPAARAIRAADPTATILAPASSRFVPWKFFDTVFRLGLLKEIDAVSVHPYRLPATNPESAAEEIRHMRRLIATYTNSSEKQVPIVSSEWGYSTYDKGISEAQQARFLARQWLSNLAEGINLSIWYDWRDDGTNFKDMESNFGTVKRDLTPKPAYFAAQNLIRDLNGFRYIHRLPSEVASDYNLLFRRGAELAQVKWSSDAKASDEAQTPTVRKIASTNADYAALSRSAAIDYETIGLVTTSERPARLNVAVSNPESALASLQIEVAGKTQNLKLLKAQTGTIAFDLPTDLVMAGSRTSLPVKAIWNGQKVELPSIELQSAYPLLVSTIPISTGLRVEITNPRPTVFTGEIKSLNASKTISLKTEIPVESTKSFDISFDSAQTTVITAVDAKGVIMARLGPFKFQPLEGFPTTVGASGSFNVIRHAKNTPQQLNPVLGIESGAGAPVATAISIPFEPFPDSLYRTLNPSKTTPIPSDATAATVWVHSDGNGLPLVARFRDSTGQVFQPTLAQMTWTGWKALTIPFSGDMWHFGGANDGIPHGALTLDTLLLLDNSRAQSAKGQILVGQPTFVIGESALPNIPGL